MKFKKVFSNLEQEGQGSDMPTFPRAILHHTDPNAPNISGGSVSIQTWI